MRPRSAGLILLVLAPLAVPVSAALASPPSNPRPPHVPDQPAWKIDVPSQPSYGLEGVGVAVANTDRWYRWATEQLRAKEAARVRSTTARAQRSQRSSPGLSGSCEAMRPAGFPSSIVMRESGGNPTARNASGAYGCAQIMPMHFNSGGTCAGLGYADCWAKMYREQGLRPWACTPESGCG
jgi:hypothetical protein